MKFSDKKKMDALYEKMRQLDYITPESIPNIDLYMDQITTFMDAQLKTTKRYPDEKILTKTMINNYTKNALIPPPKKKKYSKEHLYLLIFVYYMKDFLPISDIKEILAPLTEQYFRTEDGITMSDIYEDIFGYIRGRAARLGNDILTDYEESGHVFDGLRKEKGTDKDDYLDTFAFICSLSFDVYAKKKLIEILVDSLKEEA